MLKLKITDYTASANVSIGTADTSLNSLDSNVLYSPCMLARLQNRQSTTFSEYDASSTTTWASIQSIYGVTSLTDVQLSAAGPTATPPVPSRAARPSGCEKYYRMTAETCAKLWL
ncbi:hypothetical protein BKA67DRAFT_551822 [Truncatella angustata]|uniref:Uncharacterized protein n=1 Tax=Truncatella angustata TaxID=152316 RepID=A0A9P9A0W7_9PEZI|nr:uncharacterized protein BKA67DRAFT_551822 [Truncatella angustata]KAH6656405.1 hypothetical protein BKA67DRAFT_551822 [Truncatella angustata]